MRKQRLLLVAFIIGFSLPTQAANWYVSQAVSTSGNGQSWSTAWKNTSNIVWSSLAAGDTLYIDGGTSGYSYAAFPTISATGITILRSSEANRNGIVTLGSGWTMSGSNNTMDGGIWHGFTVTSRSPVRISGNNNRIRNIFFNGDYSGSGHSLILTGSNGTTRVEYADFYQSSFEDQFDIPNVNGGTFVFDHCVFRDNNNPNAYLGECGNPNDYCHRDVANPYTGSGGWSLTLSNNIFFHTPGHASRQPQGDGILLQVGYGGGANPLVEVKAINNVVYNTARFIAFGSGNSGVNSFKVYNNTVRNARNGDNLGITGASYTSQNNIGNNVTSGFLNATNPLGADGIPFTADDGFNLLSNAAAINAGTVLSEVPTDIRGNSRGSSPDLGAYEFNGTQSTVHYVRPEAAAGGSGNSWTDAYRALPASPIRGDTYYLADGAYGSYTFGAGSGSGTITILKAVDDATCASLGKQTSECRGPAADGANFQSSFDGVASFTGWTFTAGNWTIDGQKGSGALDITDRDYGFKVQRNSGYVVFAGGSGSIPNVTVKHTEVEGGGNDGPNCVSHNKGFFIYNGSYPNWRLSHNYLHDFGNMPLDLEGLTQAILEYNYIARNESYSGGCGANNEGEHAEGLYSLGSNNSTIRYNVWEDIEGTGVIMLAGSGWKVYGNVIFRTGNPEYTEVSNGSIAKWSSYAVSDSIVVNNTVANCIGVCGVTIGAGNTIENNLITSDPSYFVDFNGPVYDFHLIKPTAAGTTLASPYNVDMDGIARGSSGVWDFGAYEFGGTTPPAFVYHPADTTPQDKFISLNEATFYGSCWRSAPAVPVGCPSGINMATVETAVRGATLWNGSNDGEYSYQAGVACPACWDVVP